MALKFKLANPEGVVVVGVMVEQKPVVAQAPALVELKELTAEEALAEELTALWRKYEEHDMKQVCARIEKLKKDLQSIANEKMEDAKPAIFTCGGGEVEFSPRGETTVVVNPQALVEHLCEKFSPDVAFSCVKIGLTELKKVMTEHEMQDFVKKNPGSRTLKGVRLSKETAA
jgi:hypothetical protein